MTDSPVVVTGIGLVTPLGADTASTLRAWRAGETARTRRVQELSGTPLEGALAVDMPEFDVQGRIGSRRMLKYMSPAAVLGCLAAREAMDNAAARDRFASERIGLYAATGLAATEIRQVLPVIQASIDEHGEFSCLQFGEKGLSATNPLMSFRILANMPPCVISVIERVRGPNYIFTPSEGQTAAALSEAWHAVATGEVDCALAGAAEDATNPATMVYLRTKALLDHGEAAGAAAAYFVLERASTATRDRQAVHAHVAQMEVIPAPTGVRDPLAKRMGRCYAASPAVAFALSCLGHDVGSVRGSDHQQLDYRLGAA